MYNQNQNQYKYRDESDAMTIWMSIVTILMIIGYIISYSNRTTQYNQYYH
jgi:hypothetical protein